MSVDTTTLTQSHVESELNRLSTNLELATARLAEAAQDAAEKEVAYKVAFAKACLRADEATVGDRERRALIEVEQEYREYKYAEALHSSQQELMRTLRAQLSALQTISANIRGQT